MVARCPFWVNSGKRPVATYSLFNLSSIIFVKILTDGRSIPYTAGITSGLHITGKGMKGEKGRQFHFV